MKKRVLSALLALCLTLSLAGAAFAENEPSGDSSSAASQAVSSVESDPQTQDETVSSGSVSGEDQTAAKTESTPAPTETPAASDVAEEEPESTPQPEAATEPDTTPAPTEDPVADVTENEESDGSVEYTAALETDGETMNVIVTAPEGAFAEGVQPKLSVTMLTAEDELNAVADKLKNAEVQYDGFTALDITFTDKATGEEVEPVKSVAVRIELPQAIVDSGIDLSTLAVQHLEEDENGNVQKVTEVATLDNGITLSEEAAAAANEAAGVAPMSDLPAEEATAGDATEIPAAVAEFSVNGFSKFTIIWQNSEKSVTVQVVDVNGKEIGQDDTYEIPVTVAWLSQSPDTNAKTVEELAKQIEGIDNYEFQYAALGAYDSNQRIDYIRLTKSSSRKWETSYKIQYRLENGWGYNDLNNRQIYFVFQEKESPENPDGEDNREEVKFDSLPQNSNNKNRAAVNFYVNLSSEIANSTNTSETPPKDNFTASVRSTTLSEHPTTFKYTKVGEQYVVLQGASNGSAYDIDQEIRALAGDSGEQGFKIASFPSDDDVFDHLKGLNWTDWKDIKVGDTTITFENRNTELNSQNYSIRWYVFKYDGSDAWHVDGILVPRYGRLTVTKTFEFDQPDLTETELLGLVPDSFSINVQAAGHQSYQLKMAKKSNSDSISRPGWDSYAVSNTGNSSSITFNWEIDVMDYTYTISEENTDVLNYSLSGKNYTATSYAGTTSSGAIGNGFTFACETLAEDEGNKTAVQSAALTNSYTHKKADLVITKDFTGLDSLTTEEINEVVNGITFTVSQNGEQGESHQLKSFDQQNGSYTITIPNLNVGEQYTVSETVDASSDPENYTRVTYIGNDQQNTGTTTSVTLAESGSKVEFHNVYTRDTSDLTIKKVFHGLPDLDTAKEAAAKVTFNVGMTAAPALGNVVAGENGVFTATTTVTGLDVGETYVITENCQDTEDYRIDTEQTDLTGKSIQIGNENNEVTFDNYYTSKTGTLILEKKVVNGSDNTTIETDQTFSFTVSADLKDGAYGSGNEKLNFINGTATVQIKGNTKIEYAGIPAVTYTVTESEPADEINNATYYYVRNDAGDNGKSETVTADSIETISITNTYKAYHKVTVEKVVNGSMGDKTYPFEFESKDIATGKANVSPADGATLTADGFKLKNGSSVILTKVRAGTTIVVSENAVSGYTTLITVEGATNLGNGNVARVTVEDEDVKIIYTNTLQIVAPTGLEDNHTKPFGLMVGVAVMAGLALAGGAVVRRRRRWME